MEKLCSEANISGGNLLHNDAPCDLRIPLAFV